MINTKITLPKGYFVIDTGNVKNENLIGINKLLSKLEKANVVLSGKAIEVLSTLSAQDFDIVSKNVSKEFKPVQGNFLRPTFATGEDLDNEQFSFEDFCTQIEMYFFTYGLGEVPEHLFVPTKGRKVEIDNLAKRKEKKTLNNTFRIIDVKSTDEFISDVAQIIEMPIVFGAQQIEFVREAFNKNILDKAVAKVQAIKVKENIFSILEITGKDFFKSAGILKTATDILRYAYFVSEEDYKLLPKGVRFNLKTSDKKVIMAALNTIASKDVKNVFGDMKPNKSQWLALSKNLFPGSSKFNKFSAAQGVFDFLRNNGKVETFNTITQAFIKDKNFSGLAVHLSKKPGELLRSLDMIIRNSSKAEIAMLIDVINEIKLNPKLVIQVRKWLEYRTEHGFTERTFKVKGKPVTVDNKPLPELKTKRTMKVVKALRGIIIRHLEGKSLFDNQIAELEKYEVELAEQELKEGK